MADMGAASRWVAEESDDSTINQQDQLSEMQWFADAAADLQGVSINVLSDGIPVQTFDAEVLSCALLPGDTPPLLRAPILHE